MSRTRSILTAIALAVSASGGAFAQSQVAPAPQVPLIEPAQVRGLVSLGGKITIVDVRTAEEFAQGHLDKAILMPLDGLPNTYTALPKTGRLIVYCRAGHRSAKAVQFLIEHGYRNAVSMNGGYNAWTQH